MKRNNIFSILLVWVLVTVVGCTDFVEPNIPYKDFDTGTYLRTIARTSTTFNLFNLGGSNFALTLEAVDIQNGATVQTVEIRARHRRGNTLRPAISSPDVLVATLNASNFQPNSDSRFLRASFNIPAMEVIQRIGITPAEIRGGDAFDFRLVLTTTNGRVFTDNNRSGDIAAGFFYQSPFFYRVFVVCPSDLAGTFDFSTVNITAGPGGNAGACGGEATGQVTIAAVAGIPGAYTVSDVSFGVFDCAWGDTPPGGSVRLNDACGKLTFSGSDKYGDTYTFTFVSNTGTELTFDWTNSYGDGGRTTLTRSAGVWPPELN
jgi:hypothetical protein